MMMCVVLHFYFIACFILLKIKHAMNDCLGTVINACVSFSSCVVGDIGVLSVLMCWSMLCVPYKKDDLGQKT